MTPESTLSDLSSALQSFALEQRIIDPACASAAQNAAHHIERRTVEEWIDAPPGVPIDVAREILTLEMRLLTCERSEHAAPTGHRSLLQALRALPTKTVFLSHALCARDTYFIAYCLNGAVVGLISNLA